MPHIGIARSALKRGALLTAANWQVVVIQAVGDSAFKLMLAIPLLGGALLVTLLAGQDVAGMLGSEPRDALAAIAGALFARPIALAGFSIALGSVALAGSVLMFLIKGGTMTVLVDADRQAGPIEHPPLRLAVFRQAMCFTVDRFTSGAAALFRRYLVLGLALIAVYGVSASVYAAIVFVGYRNIAGRGPLIGWTFAAVLLAIVLVAWTMAVNLFYLLTQLVVAVSGGTVGGAARVVIRFLKADGRPIVRIFVTVLLLVILVTGLSLVATAGMGLIAFVPLAGVAVLPLQLVAWLLRNLVFQFLGLTALSAYLARYRKFAADAGNDGAATPQPTDLRSS